MSETIYNINWKQRGLPMSYSRKRNNAYLDPFVSMKHIQHTNKVSSSHYIDVMGSHIGSKETKNKKHGSYDRYLRELKSPYIKSKGNKTGIVKGCKCGSEPELTNNVKTIDIAYNKNNNAYNIDNNVYAIKGSNAYYEKAKIKTVNNDGTYEVEFYDEIKTTENISKTKLEPYFGECKCGIVKNGKIFISDPTKVAECGGELSNEYFIQMGGYFKRIACL